MIEDVKIIVRDVESGENPTRFVNVTPLVPASHYKLYEVMVAPPSLGALKATQSTSIWFSKVKAPLVGAVI